MKKKYETLIITKLSVECISSLMKSSVAVNMPQASDVKVTEFEDVLTLDGEETVDYFKADFE